MAQPKAASGIREFIDNIKKQKQIDHEASHSNLINQWLHLISSSMFLYCYAIFFNDYVNAVYLGLLSLILRQAGHYVFEPPCHEKEQAMLGFDTRNKVRICITYGVVPALVVLQIGKITKELKYLGDYEPSLADIWLLVTFCVIFGRVLLLCYRYNFTVSMHWFIKFITDPFTDIPAYWRSSYQMLQPKPLRYALSKSFPALVSPPKGFVHEHSE